MRLRCPQLLHHQLQLHQVNKAVLSRVVPAGRRHAPVASPRGNGEHAAPRAGRRARRQARAGERGGDGKDPDANDLGRLARPQEAAREPLTGPRSIIRDRFRSRAALGRRTPRDAAKPAAGSPGQKPEHARSPRLLQGIAGHRAQLSGRRSPHHPWAATHLPLLAESAACPAPGGLAPCGCSRQLPPAGLQGPRARLVQPPPPPPPPPYAAAAGQPLPPARSPSASTLQPRPGACARPRAPGASLLAEPAYGPRQGHPAYDRVAVPSGLPPAALPARSRQLALPAAPWAVPVARRPLLRSLPAPHSGLSLGSRHGPTLHPAPRRGQLLSPRCRCKARCRRLAPLPFLGTTAGAR